MIFHMYSLTYTHCVLSNNWCVVYAQNCVNMWSTFSLIFIAIYIATFPKNWLFFRTYIYVNLKMASHLLWKCILTFTGSMAQSSAGVIASKLMSKAEKTYHKTDEDFTKTAGLENVVLCKYGIKGDAQKEQGCRSMPKGQRVSWHHCRLRSVGNKNRSKQHHHTV